MKTPLAAFPSAVAIEAELLRRSLRRFVEAAWPIVEPSQPFVANGHIDAICAHLESVSRGELTDLLINIPPGCMKSLLVSVFWPAWEWTTAPHRRYLCAPYGDHLSTRDNLKMRAIIESPWYQAPGRCASRPTRTRKPISRTIAVPSRRLPRPR